METRNAIRGGIVATLLGIAEELLFGLFGGDEVLAEAWPVLVAFMPPVGIGILFGLAVYLLCIALNAKMVRDERNKKQSIDEMRWLARFLDLLNKGKIVNQETRQKGILAWEKHKKWFPDDLDDQAVFKRAHRIIEIMNMYGYSAGLKKIDQEMHNAERGDT